MIKVFPSLLTKQECQELLQFDDDRVKLYRPYPEMDEAIQRIVFPKLDFPIVSKGVVSKNNDIIPVCTHLDTVITDETHKLLIYLNPLSEGGGTDFLHRDGSLLQHVSHSEGGVVLFDIRLLHRGEAFPTTEIKRTCGLRVSFF